MLILRSQVRTEHHNVPEFTWFNTKSRDYDHNPLLKCNYLQCKKILKMYFIFVLKSTLLTKGRTSKQMQSRSPVQGVGRGLATTVPLYGDLEYLP